MLASFTGCGWDGCFFFFELEERDDDATKWLCVGVVIDQGSDGCSLLHVGLVGLQHHGPL